MKVKHKALVLASMMILLTGCQEKSISGFYISHESTRVELLQLTQTTDHHLVGTIQQAYLKPDGRVTTSAINVTGVVDGENITLTAFSSLRPIGQNFGGTVTSSGLSFTLPATHDSPQTRASHFDHGSPSDYDAAVSKLTAAGSAIQTQRQHEQKVEALNREADLLTQRLGHFVTRANRMIEQQARIIDYYTQAVPDQRAKLELARRLAAGNSFQQGQAQAVISQMNAAEASITNASDGVDQEFKEGADREAALNIGIQRFTGICLGDGPKGKSAEAIPDMGPCKSLITAVEAYKGVLDPFHSSRSLVLQTKAKQLHLLSGIWHAASRVN